MARRRASEDKPQSYIAVRLDGDAVELARIAASLKGESMGLYVSNLIRNFAPSDIADKQGMIDSIAARASKTLSRESRSISEAPSSSR